MDRAVHTAVGDTERLQVIFRKREATDDFVGSHFYELSTEHAV
uniref:Uncharacterized protein n=1 Tax=uncultured bacterium A1Q1_fos_324 TaxID=1256572 RepID=L7VUE6_9BACT|nr:hypothetical protein [uncultured bacterium A1Q1_fos_324]